MPERQGGKQQADPGIGRQGRPCRIQHRYQRRPRQQQPVEPGPGHYRLGPTQAALGEERNHPPANQAHHRRHQPDAAEHALALPAIVALHQAIHRQAIDRRQQQQDHHYRVIALLPHPPQGAAHQYGHQQRETQLQQRQQRPGHIRQPRHSPRQPQQRQARQRLAAQARLPGPGLHRREQKAGNDRQAKTEHQFMAVPGQPAAGRLPVAQGAVQGRQPQRYRQHCQRTAREEHRPERQAQERHDGQRFTAIKYLHQASPYLVAGWY
ncbi:hypothetical protein D3C79_583930 [compost metagenome]